MTKISIPTYLLYVLVLLSLGLNAQTTNLYQYHDAMDHRVYGNGIATTLVSADNALRTGRWEDAILAYDNAIAQWPYWAPAYVKRAVAKMRMGRTTEARQDLAFAQRISDNSVKLFSENRYGDRLDLLTTDTQETLVPDNMYLRKLNTLKRSGQLGAANSELESLWANGQLDEAEFALLHGNLSLLRNDYPTAIAYYDKALMWSNDPTIRHNRGLAQILLYNFTEGCNELISAGQQGYAPALDQWADLCTF